MLGHADAATDWPTSSTRSRPCSDATSSRRLPARRRSSPDVCRGAVATADVVCGGSGASVGRVKCCGCSRRPSPPPPERQRRTFADWTPRTTSASNRRRRCTFGTTRRRRSVDRKLREVSPPSSWSLPAAASVGSRAAQSQTRSRHVASRDRRRHAHSCDCLRCKDIRHHFMPRHSKTGMAVSSL